MLFWKDLLFCENMYGKSYNHKARTSFSLQRLFFFSFRYYCYEFSVVYLLYCGDFVSHASQCDKSTDTVL